MKGIIIVLFLALFSLAVMAKDRPTTYYVASGPARGVQKFANLFAIWNTTTATWREAMPITIAGGSASINGMVNIGEGVLAYGSFTTLNGRQAASLAYYNGNTWCAPESVGIYVYDNSVFPAKSLYDSPPTGVGTVDSAVVDGNDVYLLGRFNQVGLTRFGVAGLVKLTWANGGFTVGLVGNGYFEKIANLPCSFCARTTQPTPSAPNHMKRYTNGNDVYYVVQIGKPGNLFQYKVNDPSWVQITDSNNANNITGKVQDFDIFNNQLFLVGNFEHFENSDPNRQYFHIATSTTQGNSWSRVGGANTLPIANYGNLPATVDANGKEVFPALTGSGFFSIAVESATSIYVAGGYRIDNRNKSANFLAGELQTRIININPSANVAATLASERWSSTTYGPAPNFQGPAINFLRFLNGVLYAIGDFVYYNQIVTTTGSYFGNRYTHVFKNAAKLQNGVWQPAFGGYLTTANSDNSPTTITKNYVVPGTNGIYFGGAFADSYQMLSGGIFGYDGRRANETNRWHPVLENHRFVAAFNGGVSNGIGTNGEVISSLVTKKGDALIIGGKFDFIGAQRMSGIAAYTPDDLQVRSVGGGLYQYNNALATHADNVFNNRVSGEVYDIEERGSYLYAAGLFNRNNTGSCLANIARYEFRVSGRGWEPVDGGCNGKINDILFKGSLLFITGEFTYCGLSQSTYKESGGLLRGRVPTYRVAVLDTGKDYEKQSWRPLGVGLDGTGLALTLSGGKVYVGGSFTNAGGKLNTDGIARWNGDHWENVVARCRGSCSRSVNVLPYIGTGIVPSAGARKPNSCNALGTISGDVFCIDGTSLAWYSGNTWNRAGTVSVAVGKQNSVIVRNDSESDFIIVKAASTFTPNDFNYISWDHDDVQFVPSHAGFSVAANTFASSNAISVSIYLILLVASLFMFFF